MRWPHIPEMNYGDWSKYFHSRTSGRRVPLAGSLEVTFRCNNNCVHCYCRRPVKDRFELSREMSTRQILKVLDDITEKGCLWLLLTGGEPFLRHDFKKIYLHAKKNGLLITLFTNGTLITEEQADLMAEWNPFKVEISMYGATEKIYERVSRVKGSFRKCINGIESLLTRSVPLSLKSAALTYNAHEIPAMKAYAESLGLGFRYDSMINSKLPETVSKQESCADPILFRLSPDDVVALDKNDPEKMREWREFTDLYSNHQESKTLFDCGAGLDTFHIDPYGNLCICMMAREPSFSLMSGSFSEGWETFIRDLRREPAGDNECGKCPIRMICAQCPGWSMLEKGDSRIPVEYLCETNQKRAKILDINKKNYLYYWRKGENEKKGI